MQKLTLPTLTPPRWQLWILAILPVTIMLAIWFSALSFVPVPWPDDSAFYFVGREFWKWPPRWVMLPQAPFEPTYRIYNFNTMPLYPILIGFGRLVGIDGSFAIKFWPLSAFALSASLMGVWLRRAGLPFILALTVALTVILDPGLRWAAVLVRPESLIGLCGIAITLGLCLGFPRPHSKYDPVAILLAVAAYAHFNAIHLLFPVIAAFAFRPRQLIQTGLKTALYLTPWAITVAWHPQLFISQMQTQWVRLGFHHDWLDSRAKAVGHIFQDMGSPEPWPAILTWTAYGIWAILISAGVFGILLPLARPSRAEPSLKNPCLLPAGAWVLGAAWLFETKPEVWFSYYVHLSAWTFASIALFVAWQAWSTSRVARTRANSLTALIALQTLLAFSVCIFGYVDFSQAARLGESSSWHWKVYHEFIDCIDQELMRAEIRAGSPKPFRVWDPTFPDVTVELSRRHPDWDLTRTNDFGNRVPLALQHGHDVEAVVVPETLSWDERNISAKASDYPTIRSVWMNWHDYFLNQLQSEPGWKPHRYLCQRGRWQAFIFEK